MQPIIKRRVRATSAIVASIASLIAIAIGGSAALADDSQTGAGAPPAEAPVYDAAAAEAQLDDAVAALDGSDPALEPSIELTELAVALPSLDGGDRALARRLLARPPAGDGSTEPFRAEWTVSESNDSPSCSPHFCAHWVETTVDAPNLSDLDANDVPDYVDLALARAETSYTVENGALGWPDPLSDGSRGGNGRVDIYFSDLCERRFCLFGYTNTDDPTCGTPPFRCFSYLVLDDDYRRREFGYSNPDVPLSVTVAHEYNHVLQFGIDVIQDPWMMESVATWSEEHVFPDADDWLNYMPRWARGSVQPLTKFGALKGIKVYGSAVWNHWLDSSTAGFGPDVILDAWQSSRKTDPKHFAVGAYDRAIRSEGGSGFSKLFASFAAATAEWRTGSTNFPDAGELPDVQRKGRLAAGDRLEFGLPHTGYRLLKVDPGSAGAVRLTVKASGGVNSGIALVGRTGGARTGDVTKVAKFSRRGGKLSVRLTGADGFNRITAVIVNADGHVRGFSGGDWNYTGDGARYAARLTRG